MTAQVRKFDTGATRNLDEGKYDYEGFLSPLVLRRYGEYMHKHRFLSDGTMRDSDNWQAGIPRDVYIKSAFRHFFDVWAGHRGLPTDQSIEDDLCALLFNISGYLHEYLKANDTKVAITYDTATGDWTGSFSGIVAKVPPYVDDEDLGLKAGEAISAGGTD